MFENSWSLKLPEPPTQICPASLPEPSLVYQGKSNQLSVYSNNQVHNLPIRKQILALDCIEEGKYVLVLTRYGLSCFDFLSNQEKFTKEFQNAEKLFVLDNTIYVASGTSLYCYDPNGQQEYVNHLPSPIATLTTTSTPNQTIVSTSQMTMFRYSKLNIVFDYGKIIGLATSLCWMGKGVLVGTEEGSVAYYEGKKYKWKAKSIHSVGRILRYREMSQYNQNAEFQGKGKEDRIVVVRTDGNIELRDWENGATLAKIKTGETVVSCFVMDFRKQGTNQIVCALESGTIKAFNLKEQSGDLQQSAKTATAAETLQKGDELQKLNKIKQQLLYKISELKNTIAERGGDQDEQPGSGEILSSDVKMTASLDYKDGLILQINAANGYISGLTFQQPLMPIFVEKQQSLKYKFLDSTQSAGEIVCQVLVHSSFSASKYQVRKLPIFLHKFWKWGLDPTVRGQISGKLKFKAIQRNSRYLLWTKQCFFMNISPRDEENLENSDEMKLRFYNWYDKKEMEIIFSQTHGTVTIMCNCLKTMGQIFQDLINYLGLKHLNSELNIPEEKQKIKGLLQTVQRLSQTKTSMTTDLADSLNTIKFLLVKGQSARIVGLMPSFRKTYAQIMQHNRNLITQIDKKNANTKILTDTLKSVNIFINQIANVRYGEPKNKVIARCREAIKMKRFPEIFGVMEKGADHD